MLAAFSRCEARGEGSCQHRSRKPKRQLGGNLASCVSRSLRLVGHFRNSFFSVGLAEACSRGDDLGNVSSIRRREVTALPQTSRKEPVHLAPNRICIRLFAVGAVVGPLADGAARNRSST